MTPERLEERIARSAELAELAAQIDACPAPADADAFWRCSSAFAALLASSAVRDLVHLELASLIEQPARRIQDSFEGVWVLAAGERFELALVAAPGGDEEPSAVLHGSPRHRLISAFWPATVEVELFHHAAPHPPDVFDRTIALSPIGRRALRRGEILPLRAWFDVVEALPASAPSFLLVLSSAPVDRLRWTYSRETLEPLKPTPASLATNHLEYAIGTLLHLDHPDAVAALSGLASHPAHHVRWSAIRAVVQLDPEQGAALLTAALADPHPHVRNAARRGLDQLGGTPPEA